MYFLYISFKSFLVLIFAVLLGEGKHNGALKAVL